MPANMFSDLVDKDISVFRRVGHSAKNYFQTIDRGSFGIGTGASGKVNATANLMNQAGTFAGTAGGVAGTLTIAMGEAAVAGLAGAGFLAAMAGPQVAVTAAVVGLALLIKGTYSNREAAHKGLHDYVWSLVDDVAPAKGVTFTGPDLEKAADAATTLMDDGKNQIKLLGSKLEAAQKKFAAVNAKFHGLADELGEMEATKTRLTTGIAPHLRQATRLAAVEREIMRIKRDAKALWDKEAANGGAIFNYVRRCAHTGNYLQAPHLIALAMKEKHSPGSVVGKPQPDYFAGSILVDNHRKTFQMLNDAMQQFM